MVEKKQKTAKAPTAPKRFEKKFSDFTEYMIDTMTSMYRNQALKALNKNTVEKFEDAQVGNFANVFLRLSKKTSNSLKNRFNDDRIDKFVKEILGNVNKQNKDKLYNGLESSIGIEAERLLMKEGLTPRINALMLETSQWAKKLRDETLETFTANALRSMALGQSLEEVIATFDLEASKKKNAAKFIARNQVSTFNSLSAKIRYQKIGIKKALWITANDERVRGNPGGKYPNARPSHWELHEKEFDLNKGMKVNGNYIFPGTAYNCRCTYRVIVPGFEDLDL